MKKAAGGIRPKGEKEIASQIRHYNTKRSHSTFNGQTPNGVYHQTGFVPHGNPKVIDCAAWYQPLGYALRAQAKTKNKQHKRTMIA